MGTYLRVLNESFPMNTNMTGFRWFSKNLCIFVLWTKVAIALEGLNNEAGNTKEFLGYPSKIQGFPMRSINPYNARLLSSNAQIRKDF